MKEQLVALYTAIAFLTLLFVNDYLHCR